MAHLSAPASCLLATGQEVLGGSFWAAFLALASVSSSPLQSWARQSLVETIAELVVSLAEEQ